MAVDTQQEIAPADTTENGDGAEGTRAGKNAMDPEILELNRLMKTFGGMEAGQRGRALYMLNSRFGLPPSAVRPAFVDVLALVGAFAAERGPESQAAGDPGETAA